jgi:hypothetical protein
MISIRQAVMNVCSRYYPGQIVLGYQIYNDTITELKAHAYAGKPLQETVARRYREVKGFCGMESSSGKSEYLKRLPLTPTPVGAEVGRKKEDIQPSLFQEVRQ